jgi:hypothetical protein
MPPLLSRRLSWREKGERSELAQGDLPDRPGSLVILGEAGMGKSELTLWLGGQPGHALCTARQLLTRHDPRSLLGNATTLVIDALDEVPARSEGEAVDLVLAKLSQLGTPRFVLTCRAADWRSATSKSAIRGQYGSDPLELQLEPFDEADARRFLEGRVGGEVAEHIMTRFAGGALGDLLGNPQTLGMLAEVAGKGKLPESLGGLFDRYIALAWHEHNEERLDDSLDVAGREAVLDALGAAFAALILSGREAISRRKLRFVETTDLPLQGIANLRLAGALKTALGSRLAKGAGEDRFTFPHRRIGEFLGARWLARAADCPRKRRRMLALFHSAGLVPASLRGLHAWLAWHDYGLADAIIAADPMGVIEYGDADALTAGQGRALLAALHELAEENPRFRGWQSYNARGLVQPALLPDIRTLVTDQVGDFALRWLVLQQLRGSPMASELAPDISALMLDTSEPFALRSAAAEALLDTEEGADWQQVLDNLQRQGGEDALRLAVEILDASDYAFDTPTIADIVIAYALLDNNTIGVLYMVEKRLPDDRLDEVLNAISDRAPAPPTDEDEEDDPKTAKAELADIAYGLIARRAALGVVEPERFWSWIAPLDGRIGYHREPRKALTKVFAENGEWRRAIQRHAMFDAPGSASLFERGWHLLDKNVGLELSAGDVLALLDELGPPDFSDPQAIEQFKDVVQLAPDRKGEGAIVLQRARELVTDNPNLLAWLELLRDPPKREWEIKREAREAAADAERQDRWATQRKEFVQEIEAMRAGEGLTLIRPAKAYLGLYHGIGPNLPPQERIALWLGPELAEAAHAGFEAYLHRDPMPDPNADQIIRSYIDGKEWGTAKVIVAALAERHRKGSGFNDLNENILRAGLYELWYRRYSHSVPDGLIGTLEDQLRQRLLWEDALRGYIEPQIVAAREHIDGLYQLMRSESDAGVAERFAADWLDRYPQMAAEREAELVDRLIRSGAGNQLRQTAAGRRQAGMADNERRRNWLAVELLVDFDKARAKLEAPGPPERLLLWNMRARFGGRQGDGFRASLSTAQLEWLVGHFRAVWPMVDSPMSSEGSSNDWDASSYIVALIAQLGNRTTPEAIAALERLRDLQADSYTDALKRIAAEQRRKLVEETFRTVPLEALAAVAADAAPQSAADLQALMLEELAVLAKRLAPGGDDANPVAGFYREQYTKSKGENDCRDHLLALLRPALPDGIRAEREASAGGNKASDFAITDGVCIRLPVEVKGQWHKDLWHAADTQLDRLYTPDWQADRRGIYLVLWFGGVEQALYLPKGMVRPASAEDLRDALEQMSPAAQRGDVAIVVLDLARGN